MEFKKLIEEAHRISMLREGKDPFATLDVVRSVLFDIATQRIRGPKVKTEIERCVRILQEYLNTVYGSSD